MVSPLGLIVVPPYGLDPTLPLLLRQQRKRRVQAVRGHHDQAKGRHHQDVRWQHDPARRFRYQVQRQRRRL